MCGWFDVGVVGLCCIGVVTDGLREFGWLPTGFAC